MDKNANMGIGTLMIFISVLLVAAIAAGVLLTTQGRLQEKALSTGDSAKGEIATLLQVVTVTGEDGSDKYIDTMQTILRLSPGSTPIYLHSVNFLEGTMNSSSSLTYRQQAECKNDVFTGYFTARKEGRPMSTSAFEDSVSPSFSFSPTQTSEMMIGKIAIAIVFVESNGSVDPNIENWTQVEQDFIISDTVDALNWWNAIEPRAHIEHSFEIHDSIPVSYEPITRDTSMSNQTLWINEALDGIGAPAGANTIVRGRAYADELRERMNAHWAFIFFVADSSDTGGGFPDNYAGIAYINGPYVFVASDSWGVFTPALITHEFGHIFGARDQYNSSGCTCSDQGGYFDIDTENCDSDTPCLLDEPSIMRGGLDTIIAYYADDVDIFARAQMGLIDTDQNNLLDPIDLLFEGSSEADVSQANINRLSSQNFRYDASSVVGFFATDYLNEGSNHIDGGMVRGDVVNMCHELSRAVGEDEKLTFRIIPLSGNPTPLEFITSQAFGTKQVQLYP